MQHRDKRSPGFKGFWDNGFTSTGSLSFSQFVQMLGANLDQVTSGGAFSTGIGRNRLRRGTLAARFSSGKEDWSSSTFNLSVGLNLHRLRSL